MPDRAPRLGEERKDESARDKARHGRAREQVAFELRRASCQSPHRAGTLAQPRVRFICQIQLWHAGWFGKRPPRCQGSYI
jgi:hypothetical protein